MHIYTIKYIRCIHIVIIQYLNLHAPTGSDQPEAYIQLLRTLYRYVFRYVDAKAKSYLDVVASPKTKLRFMHAWVGMHGWGLRRKIQHQ